MWKKNRQRLKRYASNTSQYFNFKLNCTISVVQIAHFKQYRCVRTKTKVIRLVYLENSFFFLSRQQRGVWLCSAFENQLKVYLSVSSTRIFFIIILVTDIFFSNSNENIIDDIFCMSKNKFSRKIALNQLIGKINLLFCYSFTGNDGYLDAAVGTCCFDNFHIDFSELKILFVRFCVLQSQLF